MTPHRPLSPFLFAALLAIGGLTLAGCGQAADDQLREEALANHQPMLAGGDQDNHMQRTIHGNIARSLDAALQRHPDADEGLRQLVSDIRDGEQRLGDGEVSGAEAEELRDRQAELWSHLERGDLPPEYR